MKVRVLGCSGAIARDCRTTSFLLDHNVLVDAGTGVGDLTLAEMTAIDHVLLTHSHLDHVAALPLMLDSVGAARQQPVCVHALPGTIEVLRRHIFNDSIWPDFSRIPSPQAPFVRFEAIAVGQRLQLGGKTIEVLPAVHTVPAVAYAATAGTDESADPGDRGYWVFSGDTERNPAFWARVNQLHVRMLVIETAFSNREAELARKSLHLSPQALAQELDCIAPGRQYPVYITHTKPAETALIMEEVQRFDRADATPHDIRWLVAGQEFEL